MNSRFASNHSDKLSSSGPFPSDGVFLIVLVLYLPAQRKYTHQDSLCIYRLVYGYDLRIFKVELMVEQLMKGGQILGPATQIQDKMGVWLIVDHWYQVTVFQTAIRNSKK